MLTARKLLIPGTATTAKKAPLPDPLYVYCTKMLFAPEGGDGISDPSIPQGSPRSIEKSSAYSSKTPFLPIFTIRDNRKWWVG